MTGYTVVGLVLLQIPKLLQILYTTTARCLCPSMISILYVFIHGSCVTHTWKRQQAGERPSVHTTATLFQKLCYENKDNLSGGIIVAGWDKEVGPSVYNIPVGGGLFRQPWAIGGQSRISQ